MDDLSKSPTAENDTPLPQDAPVPANPEASTSENATPVPDHPSAPGEPLPADNVSKLEEPPTSSPSTTESAAPAADEAIASGSQTNPSAFSVSLLLRRIGASIGVVGVLLVFGGVFLPTYGSGDYEESALRHAPWLPLCLLIAPALLILGISVLTWFRKPPLWLVVLGSLFIILAVWVHWLVGALFAGFACFDVCPPGGVHYGTGFWLPVIGFPVSGIGIIFAALASVQWRRAKRAAQTPDPTSLPQSV